MIEEWLGFPQLGQNHGSEEFASWSNSAVVLSETCPVRPLIACVASNGLLTKIVHFMTAYTVGVSRLRVWFCYIPSIRRRMRRWDEFFRYTVGMFVSVLIQVYFQVKRTRERPMSRLTANTQAEDRPSGVAHTSRAISRSQRRSESCKPYKRQSSSRSRASRKPASKNNGTTNATILVWIDLRGEG